MLTLEQAQELAANWVVAWNAHDLERILSLYSADFTMSSPYIAQITGAGSGQLVGREAVGAYWRKAFEKYPDLRFEPLSVLAGCDSVVLNYHSIGGRLAAEVFFLDADGRIVRAAAHYV